MASALSQVPGYTWTSVFPSLKEPARAFQLEHSKVAQSTHRCGLAATGLLWSGPSEAARKLGPRPSALGRIGPRAPPSLTAETPKARLWAQVKGPLLGFPLGLETEDPLEQAGRGREMFCQDRASKCSRVGSGQAGARAPPWVKRPISPRGRGLMT